MSRNSEESSPGLSVGWGSFCNFSFLVVGTGAFQDRFSCFRMWGGEPANRCRWGATLQNRFESFVYFSWRRDIRLTNRSGTRRDGQFNLFIIEIGACSNTRFCPFGLCKPCCPCLFRPFGSFFNMLGYLLRRLGSCFRCLVGFSTRSFGRSGRCRPSLSAFGSKHHGGTYQQQLVNESCQAVNEETRWATAMLSPTKDFQP